MQGSQAGEQSTNALGVDLDVEAAVGEEIAIESGSTLQGRLSFKLFRYGTTLDYVLIAFALIFNVGNGVLMPIFMSLFGDLINGIGSTSIDTDYYIFWLLKLGAISFALSLLGAGLMELAAERQLKALKENFLSSIMRQEMAWFDCYDPGKLSSTLNENTALIRDALGIKLAQLGTCVGLFVGGYVVGFIRGWKLTLVLLAILPVLALGGFILMSAMAGAASGTSAEYAKAGSVAEEAFSTIRSIVAFGLETRVIDKFSIHLKAAFNAGTRGSLKVAFGMAYTYGSFCFAYALGFWYSGRLVSRDLDRHGIACLTGDADCFTGGEGLGVFFCVVMAAFALGQASPSLGALGQAAASMDIMHKLISRKSQIDPDDPSGFKSDVALKGEIEFKNVKFRYPTRHDRVVFNNLNLKIEAGKSTALVGASGCGKSTIIQLVERFYDVNQGQVLIDGRNIQDYNVKWLRQQMALVSQEPRLFATSVEENISAGKEESTSEEVRAAAKSANAHDFIMGFPSGYETYVGEAGSQLSGGQKQRVAIARAILRDPSVLILDEATSALDNESEKIVQDTLDKVLEEKPRTTIIIAHRLTTVRKADRIVVLDNRGHGAEVAEQGTHEELMRIPNGLYAALVASQTMPGADDEPVTEIADILEEISDYKPHREGSLMKLRSKFSKSISRLSKDFRGSRTGSRASVDPNFSKFSSTKKENHYFRRVSQFLRPHAGKMLLGFCGSLLTGVYWPSIGIILSKYIGGVYSPDPDFVRTESRKWALTFMGVGFGVFSAVFLQKAVLGWAGQKVVQALRSVLFETLMYQDVAFYDNPNHTTGKLSSMLSADVVSMKGWASDNIGIYLECFSSFVSAVVIAFLAAPKLAGVTLAAFAVMGPATAVQNMFMAGVSDTSEAEIPEQMVAGEVSKRVETTAHILNEVLLNLRTVTAYTLGAHMNEKYQARVTAQYNKGRTRALIAGLAWGLSQALPFFVQALCLWYGAKLVAEGEISLEEMMRSTMSLMLSAMGLGQSAMFMTDNQRAKEAAGRVYEVLDREVPIDVRDPSGVQVPSIGQGLKFSHIRFRYPQRPDTLIYKDLNFEIKEGEVVALVGASGCGKSTAVQLLERFYDSQGDITIDGTSIHTINLGAWRASIGLVNQEPALFDESIEDNIAMGKVGGDATPEDVVAAATLANAASFIQAFPEGFQTSVGKLGGQLSGGQKQRIAIARALIRNPQILILDEATSALDAESEKVVQAALDELLQTQKRTTIVIAHRLSTIRNADKIVVLVNQNREGSRVAEIGTHDSLMEIPNGVYRGLVKIAQGK
eukprot:Gregarina_sp_Pseudo_9__527@NODE_133_length_4090_cov_119_924216_g125_i0_p1_GENE_NODE_133_length_4090_cov_119_924216_g125_i0NODE_133_length_4090_cov_119_924216_g125_i0_p1_ORF_typecomplete_len1308_score219_96ABC_membrane/PF00664_23/3_4e47ABC_membrane/PF00664_23/3_3e47ABC_tran/PF00005_27/2_1e41ABC_tran/PF00005_27/2_6e39SMC_N/PF02463_19/23SMC_N/PF02463_19/3_3e05SMC_N/PF02463_19/3_5e02SMC_N/PF02463_19/2_6e06AAA_21/PF13304_6/0_00014AAA_21/PF13304_6/0_012AAA_15/PF13175_6/0_00019AAA_15/PF13175_6/0_0032AA